jgi:catechol 2,3-dioxygenase-like lactoylglutathione lyase family enzyme
MSRILGEALHHAYVYKEFDAQLDRLAAGGIGPFFVLHATDSIGLYRGEEHPLSISAAFCYSGDTCIEIITPHGPQKSAYAEFLDRNPAGGLHHIAYHSDDFDATLRLMEEEGKPLRVVQEFFDPATRVPFEIYCEPIGVDNPVLFQLMRRGVFDQTFEAMRQTAATWDGSDPIRPAGLIDA